MAHEQVGKCGSAASITVRCRGRETGTFWEVNGMPNFPAILQYDVILLWRSCRMVGIIRRSRRAPKTEASGYGVVAGSFCLSGCRRQS